MWFCPSSHQHFADKCNCVTQSTYVHAHPSFQVLMCTHELHVTVILPACARLKTPCVIFAQRVWSMQHPSAANEEQALVTGQLCVYSPSPVLSWGRCHASSLIDSQISMSLYDTPGSCGCDEHQHSYWFCRSTSIQLRVQLNLQHMCLCAVGRAKVTQEFIYM